MHLFIYFLSPLIFLRYTLSNDNGVEVKIINYGGIVTNVRVPDKNGILADIVLGYDTLEGINYHYIHVSWIFYTRRRWSYIVVILSVCPSVCLFLVNATPPKFLIRPSTNLVNIIAIMGRCAWSRDFPVQWFLQELCPWKLSPYSILILQPCERNSP